MTEVELVGNAFCLDFANTVNARPVARRDWLATPDEALTWAAATGHPLDQVGDLAAARDLRETVFRVFQPVAHGEQAPQDDLDRILAVHGAGVLHARLDRDYRLAWPPPRTAEVLMWEVAASAVELLTHGPLDRLGECPSCCWVFLDVSKNRRRRWCSMTTCGSRDKSRRYYAGKG